MHSTACLASESYVPKSSAVVVAKWPTQASNLSVSEQIKNLLSEAPYPGNSANYPIAASLLRQASVQDVSATDRLYYDAVIKQHYHRFEESKELLFSLLKLQPKNANAILLLANMHSVLGEHEFAEKACLRLITIAQQSVVATCAINAKAQNGDLRSSLQQLSVILRKGSSDDSSVAIWSSETYASLAKENGELLRAEAILSPYLDQKVPVSFWVLWADIQLELSNPDKVIQGLGRVVNKSSNQDDALILRLAIAEQSSALVDNVWLKKARSRTELRESRNDKEHAFDIALYYYFIERDYQKANAWAQINWQQAKLLDDKRLLEMTELAALSLPSENKLKESTQ
jgi:hypothetical protein